MSPRERRSLRTGIAVVLLAVVALRLAPWSWHTLRETAEELRGRAELLARLQASVETEPALQDSSVAIKAKLMALAPRLLDGRQEADAAADLHGRVNVLASAHRVRVSRMDAVRDSVSAGGLRRVSVRMAFEGDSRGTLELLGALAGGEPLLIVRDLRISAQNPTAPAALPEVLQMEATVAGWYLERASR